MKIFGTYEKPRLSIFRSNKHIYAQIINDIVGETLVSSSTLAKDFLKNYISSKSCKASFQVGQNIALKALKKNISKVTFDRGNFRYHGRVRSIAEGARNKGLIF